MSGSRSAPPVSASVKKNITAVSARLVRKSESSIQNQRSRYCTATNAPPGFSAPLRMRPTSGRHHWQN